MNRSFVLALLLGCAPPHPFPGRACPPPGTDFSAEPPRRCGGDRHFDLARYLAQNPTSPQRTTSQSGQREPVPFGADLAAEVRAFRAAWEEVIGPVPRSATPLDACEETPDAALVADAPYVLRRVTYRGAHGAFIPAYLLLPRGAAGPRPAVIVAHQALEVCGKDEPVGLCPQGIPQLALAHRLAERGLVVLAPDGVGYGERANCSVPSGQEYADAQPLLERFPGATLTGLRVSDLARGIDYLATRPEVDAARIGVVGHSLGGIDALFAAALEPRLRCAVSNAGPNLVRREVLGYLGLSPGIARWAGFGYLPALGHYNGDVARLPVEIHQLYALVPPRALFLSFMEDDTVAPRYDAIDFATGEARRAFAALGGRFASHTVRSGLTPECVERYGEAACRKDHGWYPDTEALAFPWLEACLGP